MAAPVIVDTPASAVAEVLDAIWIPRDAERLEEIRSEAELGRALEWREAEWLAGQD